MTGSYEATNLRQWQHPWGSSVKQPSPVPVRCLSIGLGKTLSASSAPLSGPSAPTLLAKTASTTRSLYPWLWCATPGTYTAPVMEVMGEAEFHKVQAGDVLVCPVTSPVWSLLLPSIGALVTETGGVLSHSSIIAREYGIPAVVATGNATAVLWEGQTVTVDGARGVVELA